ncbi:MAG: hypothetical protein K9N35_12570, partial [Candidatus Marinimicrobia bacterium]|nr:hypothetical protein [Candidatus Neomarinimicrobiota bacterium]
DALMRITYAKVAWKEGNFKYASELYNQVLDKINVLNKGTQQENALVFFYYEYSEFLYHIADTSASLRYLENAKNLARSNKMKQMISYQLMVKSDSALKKSTLRIWRQSIVYFHNYGMTVMETQAYLDLARYMISQNEISEAATHLKTAHELAVTSGYNFLRWEIELVKGTLLKLQEREKELLVYLEGLLKSVDNNYFKCLLMMELIRIYQHQDKYDEALATALDGIQLCQRYSMISELANVSILIGELYHRQKADIAKAHFYFQQAYGAVQTMSQYGIPIVGVRAEVVNQYISFLEEHFPGDANESAKEDLFAFSAKLEWVRIKDLFHYNLFLYHYMNTGVGTKTLEALEFPASSFYSATERLRTRGIPFPNFRKNDVIIPGEHYIEGLQQYCRLHRDLTWVEINERFEKDMLAYHYKLNNYNKKQLAKNLNLAYSGIVNRTKYLTSGEN